MKHLFSIFLICVLAYGVKAQVQYREGYDTDTLDNAETVYLYPGAVSSAANATDFKEYGSLEVTIWADSLSGSNAGTVYLQGCFDDACSYTYDIATLTLNGASQQVSHTEDTEFTPRKFRVKATGSGTMSTRLRMFYTWKRKT